MVWARVYSDHIRVYFSEPVESTSAQNVNNYIMANVSINNANLLSDNRTVILDAQNLQTTQAYNLIASGIADLNQPPNIMGVSSIITKLTFELPAAFNIAGEEWQNYFADQIWTEEIEYGYTGGIKVLFPDSIQFANTNDDEIYRSEMREALFYQIRLPEGQYDLTLMFAETEHNSPSARIFDVYAEGQLIVNDLNIYGDAGLQQFTAVEKMIPQFTVSDGVLNLYFESVVGEPVISGIKIQEVTTGIEQKNSDSMGLLWELYPNPFNGAFTIQYLLNQPGWVEVDLYNIQGQHVDRILRKYSPSGSYNYNYQPSGITSGIYLIRLQAEGGIIDTKKIVYLK
jgi:hypothetical protein